jgi:hypothetical protein
MATRLERNPWRQDEVRWSPRLRSILSGHLRRKANLPHRPGCRAPWPWRLSDPLPGWRCIMFTITGEVDIVTRAECNDLPTHTACHSVGTVVNSILREIANENEFYVSHSHNALKLYSRGTFGSNFDIVTVHFDEELSCLRLLQQENIGKVQLHSSVVLRNLSASKKSRAIYVTGRGGP